MADYDISKEIEIIREGKLGIDVKGAMADGLEKLLIAISIVPDIVSRWGDAEVGDVESVLAAMQTELSEKIDTKLDADKLLSKTYPVGAVYISVSATSPASLFGGTWEAIATGKTLIGIDPSDDDFNTVKGTGGSKTQDLRAAIGAVDYNTVTLGYRSADAITGVSYNYKVYGDSATSTISSINHSTAVYQADGTTPTTLQPYIVTYMWVRTA